jgi:hypothetical protein
VAEADLIGGQRVRLAQDPGVEARILCGDAGRRRAALPGDESPVYHCQTRLRGLKPTAVGFVAADWGFHPRVAMAETMPNL